MIAQNTRILWLPGADERHWDYESGSFGGGRNPAGVRIDPETALRSTVVLACVRVLSSSVAGLPLHLYRRLPDGGKELARDNPLYRVLHDRPNSWQSSYEWREQIMLHLLTHGQAFVEISGAGPQTQLVALHPSRMKVEQIENGRLRYTYREASGSGTVYAQDAIMHLRWLSDDGVNGMVPVELARDAIGLARACEIHGASFFANGARPGIVLSTDQTLSPEAAMNTRDQWERAHRGPDRAHRTAVLQGGLKVNELGGNNQESQFLESRRFQVEEVCRIYGVPPHLVGDLSRSSFSNIEQQSLDYVQNGLMPWLRRIESAIARDLVSDDNLFAEFDVRGALRADAAGRASYYNAMWNLGVLSVNEIRAAENLNPVEGGDTRFVQLNMTTLDKAVAQPEPVPATVVEEIAVDDNAPAPEPADAPTVLEVLEQYRTGALTLEGAKAVLVASFPQTPEAGIDAILAGVVKKEPEPPQADVPPEPAPATPAELVARSLPEARAMTLSIDFDRTFSADPQLWGEFARKAVADGNTVVMVSRRPDTEDDRKTVTATLGDYADAFSQVLLVGDRMKDEAAREAGVTVDVWVDDSPQFIRSEGRCGANAPGGAGFQLGNKCGKGGGGDPALGGLTSSVAVGGTDAAANKAASKAAKAAKFIDTGRLPAGSEQSTPEGHFAQASVNAAQDFESSAHDAAYKQWESLSDADTQTFASEAKLAGNDPEDHLLSAASTASGEKFAQSLNSKPLSEKAKSTIAEVMRQKAEGGGDTVQVGSDEIWVGDISQDFAIGFTKPRKRGGDANDA